MHRRKIFIVYPPDYDPTPGSGSRYLKFKSLGKAKKRAMKFGVGSTILCSIHEHPAKFTRWNSSSFNFICEVI